FHIEATNHPDRLISAIKKEGVKAGVALNPATPEIMLNYLLTKLDTVLVMTVDPGYGGQEFIEYTLPKINAVRKMSEKKGLTLDIAVDGGINEETAIKVTEQGANVLIAGSFLFKAASPQEVMVKLKKISKILI
ncbi:ribulose-phosphate 3-epimerase, partial [Candidatus Aerophobetes bacterium]|nr:ribulose-phosphate 3-epimerase [Candidatus Aerophobetes bacterium]